MTFGLLRSELITVGEGWRNARMLDGSFFGWLCPHVHTTEDEAETCPEQKSLLAPESAVVRPTSTREQIGEALRRLTEEGGTNNFVIFEVGECHYVQFLASCGTAVMYGEASSGRYCRPNCTCAPNAAERRRLLELGWRPPTRRKFLNFYRYWPFITADDRKAIVDQTVATLELFGWRGEPPKVKLHLNW
jgi:hypothetical protein